MHVDGGTIWEVFFYGFTLDMAAARKEVFGDNPPKAGSKLYIIYNGKTGPSPEQVKRGLFTIIPRALSTLTKAHAWGDLYRIYMITQRDQIDFNYASIPDDYEHKGKELFDRAEMNRLFDVGFELAKSDYKWRKSPPGFGDVRAGE
jgi:hypothetical protein